MFGIECGRVKEDIERRKSERKSEIIKEGVISEVWKEGGERDKKRGENIKFDGKL